MPYKIETYGQALEDFKQIKAYLSQYSTQAAQKFFEEYREKIESLKNYPFLYARSEIDPDFRRIVVGDYNVFYQVDEKTLTIMIARAGHGSRDFEWLLRQEQESHQKINKP